jgi:hypothetical protein
MKRIISDFNAQSFEERKRTGLFMSYQQVSQLEREKLRLKTSYDRNIKEINEHIKNIKESCREKQIEL